MQSVHEIDPARVAVYIRWSTDDQGEGTTLEVQRERCRHFVLSQGWPFDAGRIYIDDGYSGGTLERPALARLRDDVRQGRIQCVVVYKIDRLSRSVVDIVDLVLKEWEGRCFVRSTTEEINTVTPAGKMFFYLLISFAEYERNLIRERTMTGKVKRAEQGLNPGFRPPYGYRLGTGPGTFAVRETEAEVVRRIYTLYRGGTGPGEIARVLNREAPGRLWSPLAVRRILANPAYAGVLEYGRRKGRVLARAEGAFPPIVDPQLWAEVQAMRRRQAPGGRSQSSPYLLSGLARCRCGAPVGGKGVGRHRYYLCTGRKRGRREGCDSRHIPTAVVDEAIARQMRALLAAADLEPLALALAQERARQVQLALTLAQQVLTALQERRRRLEADYRSGALPARIYARELEALLAEERQAAESIRRVDGEAAGEILPRPEALWERLTIAQRRWLIRQVAAITLYRSGAEPEVAVVWRQPAPSIASLLLQAAGVTVAPVDHAP